MLEINSIQEIIDDLSEIAPTEEEYFSDETPVPYIVVTTPEAEYYGDDDMNRFRRQTIVIGVFALNKYDEIIERVRKYFAGVPYKYREMTISYNQLFQAEFEIIAQIPLNDEGGIL